MVRVGDAETDAVSGHSFWKMVGAGNDFVVIDARAAIELDLAHLARAVCPRATSVGADGLIAVRQSKDNSLKVAFHNADGSEAAFCGNGARCVARYAVLRGMANSPLVVEFPGLTVRAVVDADEVEIQTVRPEQTGVSVLAGPRSTALPAREILAGVPHVIVDESSGKVDLLAIAARNNEVLKRANITAVRVDEPGVIRVRTFERGVGETLACGSAALAAAAYCEQPPLVGGTFTVLPPAGVPLVVRLEPSPGSAFLRGEARVVYYGELAG